MPSIYEIALSILRNASKEDYSDKDVCAEVNGTIFCITFPKYKDNDVQVLASYLKSIKLELDEVQLNFEIDYEKDNLFFVDIPIEIVIDYALKQVKNFYHELKDIASEIIPEYGD